MDNIHDALMALRSGNAPPERQGDYWSEDDLKELNQLFDDGFGISETAIYMCRTEVAVYQQLLKLGALSRQCVPRARRPKPLTCGCLCPDCRKEDCPSHGKGPDHAGSV